MGHAKVSEEDHPWVGADYGWSVDSLTEGFKVVHKKPSQDSEIRCAKCDIKAEWI